MSVLLALYILVWPAIVAVTLIVLCVAVFREARKARDEGTKLV